MELGNIQPVINRELNRFVKTNTFNEKQKEN